MTLHEKCCWSWSWKSLVYITADTCWHYEMTLVYRYIKISSELNPFRDSSRSGSLVWPVNWTNWASLNWLPVLIDSLELRRLRYDLICTLYRHRIYEVLSNKLYSGGDGNMTASDVSCTDIDVDSLSSLNLSFNTRGNVCKLPAYTSSL